MKRNQSHEVSQPAVSQVLGRKERTRSARIQLCNQSPLHDRVQHRRRARRPRTEASSGSGSARQRHVRSHQTSPTLQRWCVQTCTIARRCFCATPGDETLAGRSRAPSGWPLTLMSSGTGLGAIRQARQSAPGNIVEAHCHLRSGLFSCFRVDRDLARDRQASGLPGLQDPTTTRCRTAERTYLRARNLRLRRAIGC